MPVRNMLSFNAAILLTVITLLTLHHPVYAEASLGSVEELILQEAGLEECLQTALQNNRRRPAYKFTLPMGGTIPITIPGVGNIPTNAIPEPLLLPGIFRVIIPS